MLPTRGIRRSRFVPFLSPLRRSRRTLLGQMKIQKHDRTKMGDHKLTKCTK